jgi:hypothetical protein
MTHASAAVLLLAVAVGVAVAAYMPKPVVDNERIAVWKIGPGDTLATRVSKSILEESTARFLGPT